MSISRRKFIRNTAGLIVPLAAPAIIRPALAQIGQLPNWPPATVTSGGGGGFSLIAHLSQAGGTTSAINTTGANLIVILTTGFDGAGGGTVAHYIPTDNMGNTYTAASPLENPNGNIQCMLSYCFGPTVGSGHTFTLSSIAIAFGTVSVQAWSGSAATPLDQNTGAIASSSTVQPGSITPTLSNELIVTGSFAADLIGAPTSVNSGFTISDSLASSSGVNYGGLGMAYLLQGAAAAVNPTWTFPSSTNIGAVIASFK